MTVHERAPVHLSSWHWHPEYARVDQDRQGKRSLHAPWCLHLWPQAVEILRGASHWRLPCVAEKGQRLEITDRKHVFVLFGWDLVSWEMQVVGTTVIGIIYPSQTSTRGC